MAEPQSHGAEHQGTATGTVEFHGFSQIKAEEQWFHLVLNQWEKDQYCFSLCPITEFAIIAQKGGGAPSLHTHSQHPQGSEH